MKLLIYKLAKRCLVCFLAIILAIPILTMPTVVHASSLNDIRDHWAKEYIQTAVSKGIAGGYTDGSFRPDNSVTRAEFTSMINRALGNSGTTSISFSDVPTSEWYYKEVAKGMSAAFVGGYDDNTFKPENRITRQEAAVMISRVLPTYGSSANLKSYPDYSSIADWATSSMSKVCAKGYMGAYKDGSLHPLDSLTRAQTAKILCDIVKSETIASGTTTVRTSGTTLSDRIYTNDVVLHADLGSGEATLSNCVVLGTLYVYGGGQNTVTLKNSRVANAVVEKSSSSVRLLAQGETVVANASASKTAILETSSLSGGLYGTGFNIVNIKSAADTTLKGSFGKVNVVGSSAKVDLESGTISTLNVESAGKNSDITVASSATVSTTNVNGAAAFHGSGAINTMNANTSGITYETKPRNVKSSNTSYNPDTGSSSINGITISPKNGATKVDVDDQITLTFDSAITEYDGDTVTSSRLDDLIELHKSNSSGTEINFDASISSSKKVITINPDDDLADDTKYYVTIDKNKFKFNGSGNSSFSSYFTTGDEEGGSSTIDGITIKPKNKATNVDVDTKVTLTFDGTITKYSGGTVTDSYLEDIIKLHKKSDSGTEVDFDASISNKKTVTITPDKNLDTDTKYYVTIDKNKLKFNSSGNSEFSCYFTTGDDSSSGVTYYPKDGNTGISTGINPTITFPKAIETYAGKTISKSYLVNDVITLREGSSNGAKVSFSAEINTSNKVITIYPSPSLKEGQTYYLAVATKTLRTQSGDDNIASSSVTWTTTGGSAPTVSFSPVNGTSSFSLTSNITLFFSQSIYDTSGGTPSSTYISSYITIRDNTSGSNVGYNSNYTNNTAVMTLDPISDLIAGHNYTISIPSSIFRNSSAVYLSVASSSFTTVSAPVSADTSSIDTAISNANAAKSNVQTSNNGSDIYTDAYWVTQAQLNTLTSAISVATNAKKTVTTTAQAQSAAKELDDAAKTFTGSKKQGTKIKVNDSALTYAIADADTAKKGILISTDGFEIEPAKKWVTQEALNTLNKAISDAQAALNSIKSASEVVSYTNSLNNAVATFVAKSLPGKMANKTLLKEAIDNANKAISDVRIQSSASEVPKGTTWVTSDEYKDLSDAISNAVEVYEKRTALQSEVDNADSTLRTKTSNFTPKPGEKVV